MGIAEVLVASVLGSVLLIGSAQSLKFSLQSAQVARSVLTETDLKASIAKDLKERCVDHLKPDKLTNTNADHKSKGIGTVTDGLPEVKVGAFNGDIEVVKIELTGDPTEPNRDLIVYYKKEGLGEQLNTLGGGACSSTDQDGCFYHRCLIDYRGMFENPDADPLVPKTTGQQCTLDTCHSVSQEVLAEVEGKVQDLVKCQTAGQHFVGFNDNGEAVCVVPSVVPDPLDKTCDPGEFVREIRPDGTVDCESACSGGRRLFESIHVAQTVDLESDDLNAEFGKLSGLGLTEEFTYDVRKRNPLGDQMAYYTIFPQFTRRFCRCPGSKQRYWNSECVGEIECTAPKKYVRKFHACMSCPTSDGGYWRSLRGNWSCECRANKPLKKKTVSVIHV